MSVTQVISSPPLVRDAPSIVAIDLDGTLLTSSNEVDARTLAALGHARAAGVTILLASSRSPSAMADVVRVTGLQGQPFVSLQGALVGTFVDEACTRLVTLFEAPLSADVGRSIAAEAARASLSIGWYSGMRWLTARRDQRIDAEGRIVGLEPQVADLSGGELPSPHKLLCIGDPADTKALDGLEANLPPSVTGVRSHPNYLEITRSDVDKGHAVLRLCEHVGLDPAGLAAIGDGANDVALFSVASTRIAMSHAHPRLLEIADAVTGHNDDGGVADALEWLMGVQQ
jgi:Cof subfamily protein (haloacid dehalogenase superfamily)